MFNSQINVGGGTAVASDILSGKTAIVKGGLVTGTMPNYAGQTRDSTPTQDATYTYLPIPANGYYNTGSKLRTANSNLPVRSAHGTGVVGSHVNLGFRPIFLLIGVVDRGDSYMVYDSIANIGRLVRFSSGTPFGSTNNISYLSDLSVDSTGFTFNYWSGTFEYFAFG